MSPKQNKTKQKQKQKQKQNKNKNKTKTKQNKNKNKTKQNNFFENIFIHDTRKTDVVTNLKYFRF
jgi:hypothetical protein